MSVAITLTANITTIETLTSSVPFVDATQRKILHNGMDTTYLLGAGTTPPATLVAAFQIALVAGAVSMNLRLLTGTEGIPVDGNGLKVRAFKFRNPATNANPITLVHGATNGYLLLGTAWSITLAPGQEMTCYLADQAPVISDTGKTIDITGTLTQALDVILLIG